MIIILDTTDESFWHIEYYIVLHFLDHFSKLPRYLFCFHIRYEKFFIVNMNQGQMTTVNKSQ